MCVIEHDNSLTPLASTTSPALVFTEPALPWNIDDHRASTIARGKSYEVNTSTALGTPPSFIHVPTKVDPVKEMHWLASHPELEGCRNRLYTSDWDRMEGRPDEGPEYSWCTGVALADWGFGTSASCVGEKIFARVFKACFCSRVLACDGPKCTARRAALRASAPACTWFAFRDFILTLCRKLHHCLSLQLLPIVAYYYLLLPTVACTVSCTVAYVLYVYNWQLVAMNTILMGVSTCVTLISCRKPTRQVGNIQSQITEDDEIQAIENLCLDVRGMIEVCIWASRVAFGSSVASHVQLSHVCLPPSALLHYRLILHFATVTAFGHYMNL